MMGEIELKNGKIPIEKNVNFPTKMGKNFSVKNGRKKV